MPSVPELLIIMVIVLLIFGAGKLPAIGDALGRSIKNFRRATSGNDEIDVSKNEELASGKRAELGEGTKNEIADAEVISSKKQNV